MNKYQEVAHYINDFIQENQLSSGDKLPTLTELCTQYEVGKNTIIKAIEVLDHHGIVYQVRGSGTYVRSQHRKGYVNLNDVHGFQSSFREFTLSSEVLDIKEIAPSKEIAQILKISTDENVHYVKRVRFIESRPFCVEESYFTKSYVPYLNEEIVKESIFDYLTKDLQLSIRFSDVFMKIGKLNQEQADYLSLKPKDPSIDFESIYYLKNGHPFDYSFLNIITKRLNSSCKEVISNFITYKAAYISE